MIKLTVNNFLTISRSI